MSPRERVTSWVDAFDRADADSLAALYASDAINHQVVCDSVAGRDAIRAMFAREFSEAVMTCEVENIFEDGEWAILEWKDPNGLRGCGCFNVVDGRIAFQPGYCDELTFLRRQDSPLPTQ